MTTTQDSLNCVKDIIDEYIHNDFNGIFLRPLSPYGFAIKTKKMESYNISSWLDFFKEGLEYIISLNKKGIKFQEFYSSVIAKKIFTLDDPGYVDLSTPSGIGIGVLLYNYDGDIYASDESRMLAEMKDKKFLIGNAVKNTYEEIITNEALLDPLFDSYTYSVPMCNDCAYENYCGSDPVYHYATQSDFVGKKPFSGFCNRNLNVFRYLFSKIENDKYVKNLLEEWALH